MSSGPNSAEEVTRLAKALSHPIRVRILLAVAAGEKLSPKVLAERFEEYLPTVAYHVHWLERRGFITLHETAQRRGATEHRYVITDDGVGAVILAWTEAARRLPRRRRP